MRPNTIIIILAFALCGCAAKKTANNNPQSINEENKELQDTPSSLDQEAPEYIVHIVQSGESLSLIAGKYGVTVEDLVSINNIADKDLIVIG